MTENVSLAAQLQISLQLCPLETSALRTEVESSTALGQKRARALAYSVKVCFLILGVLLLDFMH